MAELAVALTFDAEHPSRPAADPRGPDSILDVLAGAGVTATFFVQGRWATAFPGTAARIASDGHLVGNHSNYHAPMTLLSSDGLRSDVREAERRIQDSTGRDPRPWFRCPFGDGGDRPGIVEGLSGLGYRNVGWTVDSGDWRGASSPADLRDELLRQLSDGSSTAVVLFHTWPEVTLRTLPGLIAHLRDEGAAFVTVADVWGRS